MCLAAKRLVDTQVSSKVILIRAAVQAHQLSDSKVSGYTAKVVHVFEYE